MFYDGNIIIFKKEVDSVKKVCKALKEKVRKKIHVEIRIEKIINNQDIKVLEYIEKVGSVTSLEFHRIDYDNKVPKETQIKNIDKKKLYKYVKLLAKKGNLLKFANVNSKFCSLNSLLIRGLRSINGRLELYLKLDKVNLVKTLRQLHQFRCPISLSLDNKISAKEALLAFDETSKNIIDFKRVSICYTGAIHEKVLNLFPETAIKNITAQEKVMETNRENKANDLKQRKSLYVLALLVRRMDYGVRLHTDILEWNKNQFYISILSGYFKRLKQSVYIDIELRSGAGKKYGIIVDIHQGLEQMRQQLSYIFQDPPEFRFYVAGAGVRLSEKPLVSQGITADNIIYFLSRTRYVPRYLDY